MYILKTFKEFKRLLENVSDEEPFRYIKGSFYDVYNNCTSYYKTSVYKNPKSLDNFESGVRAISDIDGNLYVAKEDKPFSHNEMSIRIGFNCDYIYDNPNFLLLNRIDDTNSFAFSSSGYRRIEGKSKSEIDTIIIDILKKSKRKNPNFEFYTEPSSGGWFNDGKKKPIRV